MRLAAAEHVEGPVAELDELIERLRLRAIVGNLREREARVVDAGGACTWRRCMMRSAPDTAAAAAARR
jgi:hypothetical protein